MYVWKENYILTYLWSHVRGLCFRHRRKDQQPCLPVAYPPKYDNPLYGDGEVGMAQALLCNNQQRCDTQDGAAPGTPRLNVYVSPEDMVGTGAEGLTSTLSQLAPPAATEASYNVQRESLYLAPIEERQGNRPLPECPLNDANDDEDVHDVDDVLRKAGVSGYMPVSSTESLHSGPAGYLPMDGASRRGSRDALDELPQEPQVAEVKAVEVERDAAEGISYDTPKPTHIYAEIPFDEQEGNIYEALDDLKH